MSDGAELAGAPAALRSGQMAVCLAIGSIGLLVLGVQPVLLGPLVVEGRIAESGVGQLVTAELLAIALGSLVGTRVLRRQSPRSVAVVGGLLLAIANAAMTIHGGAALLLELRGVAGLAEGLLLALPVVAIARAHRPERTSAYFLVAQTLLQLIVAAIMPNLVYSGSRADAGFLVLTGAGLTAVLLAVGAPVWLRPAAPDANGGAITPRSAGVLFAAGAYLGGIVVVWSYFGLWLTLHGHPPAMEGRAVALSLGSQVVGALIASRVSDRLSSGYVIVACAAGEAALVAVLLAWGGSAMVVYSVSAAFGLLWLFALPSFTGLLIEIDPRRRAALYLAAAQLIGSALLPLIAGPWIDRIGVNGASWIGIAAFLSTILAIALCRPKRRALVEALPASL